MGTRKQPWLQLPEETNKQWVAFELFRNLGSARTLLEAYRRGYGKPAVKEAPAWYREWARNNRWVERARLYDEWVQDQQLLAEQKAIEEEVKKAVEQRKKAYTGMMAAGMQIMSKAELAHLRPYEARRLLRTAVQAIDTGAKGQRVELGEPASIEETRLSGRQEHSVDVAIEGSVAVEGGTGGVDLNQLADFITTLAGAGLIGLAVDEARSAGDAVGEGNPTVH